MNLDFLKTTFPCSFRDHNGVKYSSLEEYYIKNDISPYDDKGILQGLFYLYRQNNDLALRLINTDVIEIIGSNGRRIIDNQSYWENVKIVREFFLDRKEKLQEGLSVEQLREILGDSFTGA